MMKDMNRQPDLRDTQGEVRKVCMASELSPGASLPPISTRSPFSSAFYILIILKRVVTEQAYKNLKI